MEYLDAYSVNFCSGNKSLALSCLIRHVELGHNLFRMHGLRGTLGDDILELESLEWDVSIDKSWSYQLPSNNPYSAPLACSFSVFWTIVCKWLLIEQWICRCSWDNPKNPLLLFSKHALLWFILSWLINLSSFLPHYGSWAFIRSYTKYTLAMIEFEVILFDCSNTFFR